MPACAFALTVLTRYRGRKVPTAAAAALYALCAIPPTRDARYEHPPRLATRGRRLLQPAPSPDRREPGLRRWRRRPGAPAGLQDCPGRVPRAATANPGTSCGAAP